MQSNEEKKENRKLIVALGGVVFVEIGRAHV